MLSEQLTCLSQLVDSMTEGRWTCMPRHTKYYPDGAADPIGFSVEAVLQDKDEGQDFLGAHLKGPEEPGRGDMTNWDGLGVCTLRNVAPQLIAVAKAAEGHECTMGCRQCVALAALEAALEKELP